MLHYLRIAVTALCLTACVLLVALWVRSYWWEDYVDVPMSPETMFSFESRQGGLSFWLYDDSGVSNSVLANLERRTSDWWAEGKKRGRESFRFESTPVPLNSLSLRMADIAHILVAKANSQRTRPKVRVELRAAFTITFVVICFVLVILWFRSYTWRDRMVVPLTDTRFCRIDSEHGHFEFESYGPNMGEMLFSITALRHSEISAAWKRFTSMPQPEPGKQWNWEKWSDGRFFIYVPHWFLLGLTMAIAPVPWLPWRFSLRSLLIATTLVAVGLGIVVWSM